MSAPNRVKGRAVPKATAPRVKTVTAHLPGRLVRKGMRLVLITNMIKTSVQKDSTNQALWNSGAEAPKTNSIIPNVRKS